MGTDNQAKDLFCDYASYYDLLYKDKDYISEVDYIDETLKSFGGDRTKLLEFGSGTGRHGGLLAAKGYQVHGIERSAAMAARSPDVDGFSYQIGDIRDTKVDGLFDGVISLFHVISYQTESEDVHAVFENAARHLRQGGLFLFDFWYTPALAAAPPAVRVKRMQDQRLKITRLSEPKPLPNQNSVDVHYTIFAEDLSSRMISMFEECHPMRHFSLPEIDLFCQFHGFERMIAEEFVTRREPDETTFGVCVVVRKV